MPALKCPNPSCAFLFDPTQVPAGAVLTCPRCAMRFTLGPAPTATSPAAADPAPPKEPEPPAPVEAARPRRSGFGGTVLALAGVGLVVVVGVSAVLLAVVLRPRLTGDGGIDESRVEEKNFAYRMPGEPWVRDSETQVALGANVFALRRDADPPAWAALTVSDYETRSPMPHELKDRAVEQLSRVFANLPPDPPTEKTTWAGHEALKWQFRGEHKTTSAVCAGEAYLMAYKGVGYWFYVWASERDVPAVAAELEDLRDRFRTLDLREKWTERVGAEVVHRGPTGKYRLSNYEAIWDRPPGIDPAGEDPKAELLLRAELKGRSKRDFRPRATLVVMVLEQPGEPAEVAGRYVRARHTLDAAVFGPTQITDRAGDPEGDPAVGPDPGTTPTYRLKVSRGGPKASRASEKLVVFSAIRVGGEVVVAEGSCPWSEREVWERRLIQLVGSLRP